jgi:hypothetical protein
VDDTKFLKKLTTAEDTAQPDEVFARARPYSI